MPDTCQMAGACVPHPRRWRYVRGMSRARTAIALPLLAESDPPLYTGDIESDIRSMNKKRAEELGGRLSFPSKMDVASWGIPATRCRIGSALARVANSTCESCYATKGMFRFKGVSNLLEDN